MVRSLRHLYRIEYYLSGSLAKQSTAHVKTIENTQTRANINYQIYIKNALILLIIFSQDFARGPGHPYFSQPSPTSNDA